MNRAAKLATGWILCSVAAVAVAQVLPDAIQACKKETDDTRRLQCFDRETAKFPVTSDQSFGLSQSQVTALQKQSSPAVPSAATAPQPAQLTAKVASLRERPHAGFVVTLDNGQIWAQNEMEATRGIRAGDSVTIKPGVLGAFWMVGPSGWATKVRRVK